MKKVITYGTYDLLHHGHIKLLERARALGDYLIVGVTADDFDMIRGKINVQQSLSERIEAVRATGIADEIIVEEYEGQKIDDIRKYGINIFTVGSDWIGKFDYLKQYCEVIYLDRTKGISSSELRKKKSVTLGIVGESKYLNKLERECSYVNGIKIVGICTNNIDNMSDSIKNLPLVTDDYQQLLDVCDAVYIHSQPKKHYIQVKEALKKGKHVLCESPIAMSVEECRELFMIAREQKCILLEALKTAYSTAYLRLVLLIKGGKIGKVVSVDATCTSLKDLKSQNSVELSQTWSSISAWGPTALLPIFQILGVNYIDKRIIAQFIDDKCTYDSFCKISFLYANAVASLKVGTGVKSEGELIISGTNGYIYIPAPWWKTDYFEIRYENPINNKRYFYQLDGEGIRYELANFVKSIEGGKNNPCIDETVSEEICRIMESFDLGEYTKIILN